MEAPPSAVGTSKLGDMWAAPDRPSGSSYKPVLLPSTEEEREAAAGAKTAAAAAAAAGTGAASSSSSSPSASSSIIPTRLLSSLPSALLPAFLLGGRGAGPRDTFKPLARPTSARRVSLQRYSQATLATGITRAAVACPPNEDPDEWLALHTVNVYNEVGLLFGVIRDKCCPSSRPCEVMNAGAEYEYLWADNNHYKRPTKVSAREYVALLLAWVEEQLNDEAIFPASPEVPFPKHFKAAVAKIYTRLFRVYGHLYQVHIHDVEAAGALSHLNSCFRHFLFLSLEFSLVDQRELAPLQPLIRSVLAEDARRRSADDAAASRRANRPGHGPSLSAQARLNRAASASSASSASSVGGGSGSSSSSSSTDLRPKRAGSAPGPLERVVVGDASSSSSRGRSQSHQLARGGSGGGSGWWPSSSASSASASAPQEKHRPSKSYGSSSSNDSSNSRAGTR